MPGAHEILQLADHISIYSSFIPLKKKGNTYWANCPFHSEKSPSLCISKRVGSYRWKCFGCGDSGDLASFVMKMMGLPFIEAVAWVAEQSGQELTRKGTEDPERARLLKVITDVDAVFKSHAKKVSKYVAKRGLPMPDAWRYGCTDGLEISDEDRETIGIDKLLGRAVLPITDAFGQVVAFAGRRMDDKKENKWVNSPENIVFKKSKILFGYRTARSLVNLTKSYFIVEGYADQMRLTENKEAAVAIMSSSISKEQCSLLIGVQATPIIMLDGDDAGRNGTVKIVEAMMLNGMEPKCALLKAGLDPAELSSEEIKAAGAFAVDGLKYWAKNVWGQEERVRKIMSGLPVSMVDKALSALCEYTGAESTHLARLMVEQIVYGRGYGRKKTQYISPSSGVKRAILYGLTCQSTSEYCRVAAMSAIEAAAPLSSTPYAPGVSAELDALVEDAVSMTMMFNDVGENDILSACESVLGAQA